MGNSQETAVDKGDTTMILPEKSLATSSKRMSFVKHQNLEIHIHRRARQPQGSDTLIKSPHSGFK
jgi:hypothetical protein